MINDNCVFRTGQQIKPLDLMYLWNVNMSHFFPPHTKEVHPAADLSRLALHF